MTVPPASFIPIANCRVRAAEVSINRITENGNAGGEYYKSASAKDVKVFSSFVSEAFIFSPHFRLQVVNKPSCPCFFASESAVVTTIGMLVPRENR